MASKKAGNNRPGSPIKTKTNPNASRSQYEQHENDYSAMLNDRDVVRGLTEREVEIDHLRTTVIALKEQVTVSIFFEYFRAYLDVLELFPPRIHINLT
jgi:hypothetical protein